MKPPAAVVRDVAKLLEELRLTPKQRAFAEALSRDSRRDRTKAAIAAGVPPAHADARGCRMYQHPKIRRYYDALVAAGSVTMREAEAAVIGQAEWQETALRRQAPATAIAGAGEVLALLTAQMRGEQPTRIKTQPCPETGERREVEAHFEMGSAAKTLWDAHAGVPGNGHAALSDERLRELILGAPEASRDLLRALLRRDVVTEMETLPTVQRVE